MAEEPPDSHLPSEVSRRGDDQGPAAVDPVVRAHATGGEDQSPAVTHRRSTAPASGRYDHDAAAADGVLQAPSPGPHGLQAAGTYRSRSGLTGLLDNDPARAYDCKSNEFTWNKNNVVETIVMIVLRCLNPE